MQVAVAGFVVLTSTFLAIHPVPEAAAPAEPVPIDIDAHGGVFVDVRIGAAGPFRFIVDTGSARSIVSETLAADLGSRIVARTELVTSAGTEPRPVVGLQTVSVGPVDATELLAPVLPESRLTQLGPGVRGVLGQDFLSKFNYTIDYRHGRLRWERGEPCGATGAVQLVAAEGRFVMTVGTNDGRPLRLVPDSGAEVPVLFHRGRPSDPLATIPRVQVGQVKLKNVAAYVVDREDANADGLLPLHHFSEVSFAAGGACLVARP